MIKIIATEQDKAKAREFCRDARQWFSANTITNGRAYLKQGNGLNFDGVLAQVVVGRYFGAALNNCKGWDKGIDITLPSGTTADVKTTRYNAGNLLEFPEDVNKKRNDIYIFCTQTQKDITIKGWVSRNDFIAEAKTFDFGYGVRMYMPLSELNQNLGGLIK